MPKYLKFSPDLRLPAGAVTQQFGFIGRTGCHAYGQLLLMKSGGLSPVQDVKVGDVLAGPSGQFRRVLELIRGSGEMVRIIPHRYGDPFTVNLDHVLSLIRTPTDSGKPDRLKNTVVDVSVREWLGWSKRAQHIHKLFHSSADFVAKTEPLPLDPYFLGVLLGDGHMKIRVEVTTMDTQIASCVRREAKRHKLGLRETPAGRAIGYTLTSGRTGAGRNPIVRALRALGLWGSGSGDKFVPELYRCGSRDTRLAVLAGLIDTDGHLGEGVGYDYISKSPALARDVAFLARSVGLAASVSPCEKRDQFGRGGTYYRVSISGELHVVPCRVTRKIATPRRRQKVAGRTGFVVERLGSGNYYGFRLDGDGRYLMDDFTVTHNSGKTYGAGVLVECMLAAKAQVVVLDPVGIWWGLRVGAKGGKGFDIPVFGGRHADIPLQPEAGAMIANLIVDRSISAVIDVSHMRKAAARRFVTAFAEELFEAKKDNRSPMHLVLEEAQRFIPQHAGSGDKTMLGAFEDLAKIGRNFGIGWSIITQRPQAVNKDVLNQAEPLVVLQSTGTHERKAIRAWIDEQGAEVDDMFKRIAKLQKGEAFFWSPSWMRVLTQIKIGTKRTYDASSTPTAKEKKRKPKPLSKRDIEKLGKDIESAIQEAAENNLGALRHRITKLERELAAARRAQPEAKIQIKEVKFPALTAKQLQAIERASKRLAEAGSAIKEAEALRLELRAVCDAIAAQAKANIEAHVERPSRPPVAATPRPLPTAAVTGDGTSLRKGAVRMLQALATMGRELTRAQVAMLSGMSAKSGTFTTYLGNIRGAGFIDDVGSSISITDAGIAFLGGSFGETPRTINEIANLFRKSLRAGAWRMLEILLQSPTRGFTRAELAELAGMSANSGTFTTYLGNIKATGLVAVTRQDIRISTSMLELV